MAKRLVYGEESRLLPWALARVGINGFRRDAYTLGLEDDGELLAVVVYDNFSKCDCNMHITSDGTGRWMNKELLLSAFAYPFVQLGLRRVTGLVPSKNEDALKFNKHIGFVHEGYHPNCMPDDDIVTLGLLREQCRFIPREYRT